VAFGDAAQCTPAPGNWSSFFHDQDEPEGRAVSESELEETGTGKAAKRIGQAPTTTDVTDPERSSRNTAAGSGSEPGEGPVQPAADEGVDPSASIEPHNEGLV
jgi:hypothetical protein